MSITKTIGGDRLGSGKKLKTSLHNYGRSTHNLDRPVITSAACGMLIPFYTNIGVNGDKFKINLNAAVRTLPTIAPLFGSFKLQLDMFQIPIRLYQGILHNNPINIGMKMNQIKLPQIRLKANNNILDEIDNLQDDLKQVSKNCLLKYCGISGISKYNHNTQEDDGGDVERQFNALKMLAYYDIFKCYYANKQEENAYVIKPEKNSVKQGLLYHVQLDLETEDGKKTYYTETDLKDTEIEIEVPEGYLEGNVTNYRFGIIFDQVITEKTLRNLIIDVAGTSQTLSWWINHQVAEIETFIASSPNEGYGDFNETHSQASIKFYNQPMRNNPYITMPTATFMPKDIKIEKFPLENIDKMRRDILSFQELGETFVIGEDEGDEGKYLPYSTNYELISTGIPNNASVCNGLVLKTYQSDLFNNWLNTDWIDGENGIAEITAIDVSEGSLTMDALNFSQKLYNMMNRIAISGGTYDDWQEAVYGVEAIRKAETPLYAGGMSAEVVFQEIVATADTETSGENTKLGTLAGKGTMVNRKGGNITIKCNEPSIIMGIMSLTPRICYSQGNDWDMTELQTLDDLHKPELDGIGYQELMTEQMDWRAVYRVNGDTTNYVKTSAGKTPAWINYMTDLPRAYGDFIDDNEAAYMVLGRKYNSEEVEVMPTRTQWLITDLTTYIDPTKYNYPFAYTKLDAQNFWIQINCNVSARRIMSAKMIPNL